MNLLETILQAQNGGAVSSMAQSLGIDESQAQAALNQLVPAVSRGLSRNAAQAGGLDALLGALKSGQHQRYIDHPDELGQSGSLADGNAILGHIFGSKDVSRNVAGRAAGETGLDASILKKMLPMVAAMAMGSLGKQTSGGGSLGPLSGGGGSDMLGMLEGFLDTDRDGAVLDDLLGMAKKFF